MSHINLFLAGGSDQSDSLYAACSVYLLQQMRIVQYAVLDEERDKALVRIEHIKDILLQIEDQDWYAGGSYKNLEYPSYDIDVAPRRD